jgi:hypothetical protein
MNHDPPIRDACRRAWLAAYAEGQLEGTTRAQVEGWLDEHPQLWAEIQEQQALGQTLRQMMDATAPSDPSAATWEALAQRIQAASVPAQHAAAPVPSHCRQRGLVRIAAVTVASALFLGGVVGLQNQLPGPTLDPPQIGQVDPLSAHPAHDDSPSPSLSELTGISCLTLVREVDVLLERVPHMGEGWLPIGRPPLEGPIQWIHQDEIEVISFASHSSGQQNIPCLVYAEGDKPLLWTPVRE